MARPRSGLALRRALPNFFKPGAMDLVLFSRQLAVFLRAGIPLVQAVEALAEQAVSASLRDALLGARDDLVAGYPLSSALRRQAGVFPRIYEDMVRAGEATGRLEAVLSQVADQLERAESARRRLTAGLLYPALVILLALVMVAVMTAFVLPAMAGLFQDFGTELPLPTRIVLTAAQLARDHGISAIAGVGGVLLLLILFSRTRSGRRLLDRASLAVPVVGGILQDAIVERTVGTLGTLLAAGVPLVRAVELVRDTAGNDVYRRHLERVRVRMLRGEGFAESFAEGGLYPPLIRQVVRAGELTGTLDQFLHDAAKYYTQELTLRIETALRLLEPALTIVVALVVGFVALAVIMPIYSLVGSIR